MKLIFMGTPEFSSAALESLIKAGHDILVVYTRAPQPAGRGKKERKSPVHIAAEKLDIEVRTPKSLKAADEQQKFADLKADAAVVVAYGLMLPHSILEICPCINIHASLLPRWRGAAPIQRAILAGDSETGVTIMQMDDGLDTGDMLLSDRINISDDMTAGQLHDELSEMGAKLIIDTLNEMQTSHLIPVKQVGDTIYANKIEKKESLIDWNDKNATIDRQIRAFNPYPGAYFLYKNEKIKILTAKMISKENDIPNGEVIDGNLAIACKNGAIQPILVQRQGKKPMSVADMLRGFNVPAGTFLL